MRSYLEGMERAQKDKNLLYMVQMDELFHREIVSAGEYEASGTDVGELKSVKTAPCF